MVTGLLKWSNIWIYLLAELLAGVAAGWVFLYLLPGEKAAGDTEPAATS
jgi:glycerol uptake facilitator-like aquaporin